MGSDDYVASFRFITFTFFFTLKELMGSDDFAFAFFVDILCLERDRVGIESIDVWLPLPTQ